MKAIYTFFLVLAFAGYTAFAQSQIPRTISYQGVLSDTAGNPKPDATYSITFRLYEASSGGSAIWTETKNLTTKRGLFTTQLGDVTPFGLVGSFGSSLNDAKAVADNAVNETNALAALAFDRQYWMSIQVGSDPELSPRTPLSSVPYSISAIKADTAQYSLGGAGTSQWANGSSGIYYSNGTVGIGTADPLHTLMVQKPVASGAIDYPFGVLTMEPGSASNSGVGISFYTGNNNSNRTEQVRLTAQQTYFGVRPRFTISSKEYNSPYDAWVDRFTIDPQGNVGIGTTVPLAKLTLSGGEFMLDNGGFSRYLTFTKKSDMNYGLYFDYSQASLSLWTRTQPRLTISDDGKVGIGTDWGSWPASRLSILNTEARTDTPAIYANIVSTNSQGSTGVPPYMKGYIFGSQLQPQHDRFYIGLLHELNDYSVANGDHIGIGSFAISQTNRNPAGRSFGDGWAFWGATSNGGHDAGGVGMELNNINTTANYMDDNPEVCPQPGTHGLLVAPYGDRHSTRGIEVVNGNDPNIPGANVGYSTGLLLLNYVDVGIHLDSWMPWRNPPANSDPARRVGIRFGRHLDDLIRIDKRSSGAFGPSFWGLKSAPTYLSWQYDVSNTPKDALIIWENGVVGIRGNLLVDNDDNSCYLTHTQKGGKNYGLYFDYSAGSLTTWTNTLPRMTVTDGGNVGVGTPIPDQLLTVNGGASKPGGGSWSTFSDIRLKKDISSFDDGLEVLKRINPVWFRYNGKAGYPATGRHVGVIAQKVREVAPYTISTFNAKLDSTDATETELLRFDPNALTYIAINAIKELDAKSVQLAVRTAELEKVKSELADLKSRMTRLESALTRNNANSTVKLARLPARQASDN